MFFIVKIIPSSVPIMENEDKGKDGFVDLLHSQHNYRLCTRVTKSQNKVQFALLGVSGVHAH